jgi:hypothetical protein
MSTNERVILSDDIGGIQNEAVEVCFKMHIGICPEELRKFTNRITGIQIEVQT